MEYKAWGASFWSSQHVCLNLTNLIKNKTCKKLKIIHCTNKSKSLYNSWILGSKWNPNGVKMSEFRKFNFANWQISTHQKSSSNLKREKNYNFCESVQFWNVPQNLKGLKFAKLNFVKISFAEIYSHGRLTLIKK